jgi:hypothetical protein
MNPNPSSRDTPSPPSRRNSVAKRWLAAMENSLAATCRDFIQLASERQDRALTVREKARYWLHRVICSICRKQERRTQQLGRLADSVVERAGRDAGIKLPEEARNRLLERLRLLGEGGEEQNLH